MSDLSQWLDQAPAYVLGALSPGETREFEAVLARSPELRAEVARYREVTAVIGTSQPVEPPSDLRQRVLARARREGPFEAPVVPIRRRQWIPWLAAAAGIVLAIGLAWQNQTLRRSLSAADSSLARMSARLSERERLLTGILDPGVELVRLDATGEQPPAIRIYRNRVTRTAILHGTRLRPAPAGRAYQLWLIEDGQPIPSQVFNAAADGTVVVEGIPVTVDNLQAFAITEEPAGGSPQPTGPILLLGRVPAA